MHRCRDECIPMEAETTAMVDALQDAKDALADAKLRMRVAEAQGTTGVDWQLSVGRVWNRYGRVEFIDCAVHPCD